MPLSPYDEFVSRVQSSMAHQNQENEYQRSRELLRRIQQERAEQMQMQRAAEAEYQRRRMESPYYVADEYTAHWGMDMVNPFKDAYKTETGNMHGSEDLEVWVDKTGKSKKLADMTKKQLRIAIDQLDKGYEMFGQKSKIVSLRRLLKEKG